MPIHLPDAAAGVTASRKGDKGNITVDSRVKDPTKMFKRDRSVISGRVTANTVTGTLKR